MTPASEGRVLLRWLAIPGALLLLVLVGLAAGTESRDEFQDRVRERTGDGSGQPDDRRGDERAGRSGTGQRDQAGTSRSGRGQPVIIQTEDGEIIVEVDEDGNPVRIVPAESVEPVGPGRVLTPDPDGGVVGLRVTDDGRLEPVEAGDLQTDDFLLRPGRDGGIDITRPDGSRVRLEPQADGELAATEIQADGSSRDLVPDRGDVVVQPGSELQPGLRVHPDSEPIVIQTDTGPVRLDLEPSGDLVADQPGDGEAIVVDPDDRSAVRINEDGRLELVPADEIGPDDTVLIPTGDGFDLVRPDGTRIEFRSDGENDGITATEVGPDGRETELTPNPDGSVTLEDGTTIGPIDVAEDGGMIEELIDQTSELPWPWVFGAIAAIALLSIGTALYLHRNRPDDPFDYTRLAAAGVPIDRFEEFLAMLEADPDPGRAIRLAFYAAERGLAGLPTRRRDETPYEWQRRVEVTDPVRAEALEPICDLFARARFAPGQATPEDRSAMVAALRALVQAADRSMVNRDLAGV